MCVCVCVCVLNFSKEANLYLILLFYKDFMYFTMLDLVFGILVFWHFYFMIFWQLVLCQFGIQHNFDAFSRTYATISVFLQQTVPRDWIWSRGTQHIIGTVSNEATNDVGYWIWSIQLTCLFRDWHAHGDFVETLVMRVLFLGLCFKLLVPTYLRWNNHNHDTERVMFCVKVCNLWWRSDMVPQGRGVDPVQLLSRR